MRDRMKSSLYSGGYRLLDLEAASDDEVRGWPQTFQMRLGFGLLMHEARAKGQRYEEALRIVLQLLRDLLPAAMREPGGGRSLLVATFTYLHGSARIKTEDVAKLYERLEPKALGVPVNMAQLLEIQGRAKALLDLMTIKFGKLSAGTVETVSGASEEDLRTWNSRILTAETLEEMFR